MSDNLKSLLARTNDILGQGKFFQFSLLFGHVCLPDGYLTPHWGVDRGRPSRRRIPLYVFEISLMDFWKTEKAKLLQVEAQEEMANEDLKTFEKSGNLPKLTPVLFNKRKESDILETHRGNYKRHWETSSRLE